MRRGIVPELGDERMPFERLLHHGALDAAATAMHEAELSKPGRMRGVDVFLDDGRDVAWRKRVEIELRFDRDAVSVFSHYSACTWFRLSS